MHIELYNTLTQKKEQFVPLQDREVRMYHCGPTVYNYAHVGNLRPYVIWDILRRTLEREGYLVTQVVNITDVGHLTSDADQGEDKMTVALEREGLEKTIENMRVVGTTYMNAFIEDITKLNILPPHHLPRASEHIDEDIRFIRLLEQNGFTYKTSEGVYFDTSKDPEYGKLVPRGLQEVEATQSRVAVDTEKRNPRDFALWKLNANLGWESPWGKGFPGWHIECSAMSAKYLGETFDIHTGGIDHIPIHHTNEIAQSENAFGVPMASTWLHVNFLTIGEEKISKSLGNTYTLKDIQDKGFSPLSLRYLFLGTHYRKQQSFTWEVLEAAQTALERIHLLIDHADEGVINSRYMEDFKRVVRDDLNTPEALSVMWEMLRDTSLSQEDKRATMLSMDEILGLGLQTPITVFELDTDAHHIATEREHARQEKDWEKADKYRLQLQKLGYRVEDTPEGQRVYKLSW